MAYSLADENLKNGFRGTIVFWNFMSFLSPLVASIAINDADLSMKGLKALMNPKGSYFPSATKKIKRKKSEPAKNDPCDLVTWAHYLCTYTRFVYLNIAQRRYSVSGIKKAIELFKKVVSLIKDLKKQQTFNSKEKRELNEFQKNVNIRIKLSQGYI